MKATEFKGVNVRYAENQDEYQTLPAMRLPDGTIYTCWELSDEEIEEIVRTKRFYLSVLTFNQPLQPILPMVSLDENLSIADGSN